MTSVRITRLTNLTLVSLGLLFAAGTTADAARKPNVVVIVGDDMGYADIGCHGCKDIPTPHLDSLAKNGVRCTSGYVSGPYCSPTRAGLLTGRYQTRFGHEFNPGPPGQGQNDAKGLSLKETTFADRMKAAGYATGAVGKWHLGGDPAFHPAKRGFDEYFGFLGGAHPYFADKGAPIYRGTAVVDEKEYLTDAFGREAVAFIDRHQAKPFFLYLAFNAVHTPMQAADKYLKRFPDIKEKNRQTYAAMMSAMDDAIGRVLAKLRDAKLEQDTLIFFVSDNGGPPVNASSNAPLNGRKATTWEGGVRVPFLVQWKGRLPGGLVYEQPVIQLDILPTALAAAGMAPPSDAKFDGVDLLPYLEGKRGGSPHEALFWRFGPQTAVRMGDWKLTEATGSGGKKLFNLKDDIGETKDLSAAHPEKVKELQAAWDAWNKNNVPATWGAPRPKGEE
jgi:arylsulfatase A-like enzyme